MKHFLFFLCLAATTGLLQAADNVFGIPIIDLSGETGAGLNGTVLSGLS